MFGRCIAMYQRSLRAHDTADLRVKLAALLVHILGPDGFPQARQLVGATDDDNHAMPATATINRDHTTPAAAIARLVKRKQDAVNRAQQLAALKAQHPALKTLVGQSAHLLDVCERIIRYAPTALPALITGPTGSGKELVARALHACSPRAKRPLIAVNCE
jgi:transcriptional regulator with AAA-type ATPase domain